jgi:hypothetical protein
MSNSDNGFLQNSQQNQGGATLRIQGGGGGLIRNSLPNTFAIPGKVTEDEINNYYSSGNPAKR